MHAGFVGCCRPLAILRRRSDGYRIALSGHCLVGRSWVCALQLERPRVSSEHATIRWQNGHWLLRDLASSNGTLVDGQVISGGQEIVIAPHQVFEFGDPQEQWEVIDVLPPAPIALSLASDEISRMSDGLLCVPNVACPSAVIRGTEDLAWILELDGDVRAINNGDTFELNRETWRVYLPAETAAETARVEHSPISRRGANIASVRIEIRVSRDQDDVGVIAHTGDDAINLGVRSCFQLLYLLARSRVEDPKGGWLATDEILRQLGRKIESSHLNVDIFRIRRAFRDAAVPDPNSVIERRTGHLRMGTELCEITVL